VSDTESTIRRALGSRFHAGTEEQRKKYESVSQCNRGTGTARSVGVHVEHGLEQEQGLSRFEFRAGTLLRNSAMGPHFYCSG